MPIGSRVFGETAAETAVTRQFHEDRSSRPVIIEERIRTQVVEHVACVYVCASSYARSWRSPYQCSMHQALSRSYNLNSQQTLKQYLLVASNDLSHFFFKRLIWWKIEATLKSHWCVHLKISQTLFFTASRRTREKHKNCAIERETISRERRSIGGNPISMEIVNRPSGQVCN